MYNYYKSPAEVYHESNILSKALTRGTTNSLYPMTDINSVFTHFDPSVGKNVPTANVLSKNNLKES